MFLNNVYENSMHVITHDLRNYTSSPLDYVKFKNYLYNFSAHTEHTHFYKRAGTNIHRTTSIWRARNLVVPMSRQKTGLIPTHSNNCLWRNRHLNNNEAQQIFMFISQNE
jgi:hypothetical protein